MNDKNTEQGQPRTPTRPGRWYAQWAHDEPSDDMIFVASVLQDDHRLFVHLGGVTSDLRALRWLAPIPGPAVLAALAEYGEAVLALDELNVRELRGAFGVLDGACAKLHAAIRAERDAERDGGA